MTRRPDLFIVGAGTSGTTALYEYLDVHPQVYMSPIKEPDYFCPDLADEARTGVGGSTSHRFQYGRDLDRYLALFEPAEGQLRVGEASTAYLRSVSAPELIREFQPEPWIVVMIRNPIERLASLHRQRVALGHESEPDFERALAATADGSYPYLERARVAGHLARWLDVFGARVHVIVFDDFAADTVRELRRTLTFIGVDLKHVVRKASPRNASYRPRRLAQNVLASRPVHWTTHAALPRLVGANSTMRLSRRVRHSCICRHVVPRPVALPMNPELRRRLEDELRPDVAGLSRLIKRDLVALWFRSQDARRAAEGA